MCTLLKSLSRWWKGRWQCAATLPRVAVHDLCASTTMCRRCPWARSDSAPLVRLGGPPGCSRRCVDKTTLKPRGRMWHTCQSAKYLFCQVFFSFVCLLFSRLLTYTPPPWTYTFINIYIYIYIYYISIFFVISVKCLCSVLFWDKLLRKARFQSCF